MKRMFLLLTGLVLMGCASAPATRLGSALELGALNVERLGQNLAPQPTSSPPPAPSFDRATHIVVTIDLDEEEDGATAERLADAYDLELVAQWPLAAISAQCLVFRAPPERFDAALEALAADPSVTRAQPVIQHTVSAQPNAASVSALQTNQRDINAPAAHRFATGAGVRVAVIDTGLDAAHPDLTDVLEVNRDFVDDGRNPSHERHGTAVAGLIGARGGLRGVAFDAQILSLRSCWEQSDGARGVCNTLSLARALNFAATQGVDIINLSLAGPEDPLLADLLDAASVGGAVIVAASGPAFATDFPASHPRVIAVRAPSAPRGTGDVAAPASNVLSTAPGGQYDFFSGSSVAAAQVSGVAALMRQLRPDMSAKAFGGVLAEAVAAKRGGEALLIDACIAVAKAADGAERLCAPTLGARR